MVGRMAYLWGWPLVNNANRHKVFSEAPEPGLLGGVLPIAHNSVAMLTNYVSPDYTLQIVDPAPASASHKFYRAVAQ